MQNPKQSVQYRRQRLVPRMMLHMKLPVPRMGRHIFDPTYFAAIWCLQMSKLLSSMALRIGIRIHKKVFLSVQYSKLRQVARQASNVFVSVSFRYEKTFSHISLGHFSNRFEVSMIFTELFFAKRCCWISIALQIKAHT